MHKPDIADDKRLRLIVSVGILVVGCALLFPAGLPAMVIFSILWFEKVSLALTHGILPEFGIEFVTVPMILTGILYGPVTGFLVGFFGMPLMDALRWFIEPPKYTGGWPPVIPGPDTLVDGLTAAAAGFLIQIPYDTAAPILVVFKYIISPVKDRMVYGSPPKPTLVLNIIFSIFLARFLSFVVQ